MSDQHDASDDADDSPVSGPLVFSCRKCRNIVGDSFALLCSNEEDGTITLSGASHVQRNTQIFTSYESLDEGNSYFWFQCSDPKCQEKLGKYYVTTSKDLDHVREKFTFTVDAIDSYELGKTQFGRIPEADVIELPAADTTQEESVGANIEIVQEDVSKVRFDVSLIFMQCISIIKNIYSYRFTTCLWT